MSVKETNRIIAEFMGGKFTEGHLKFNSSWDWLMTVVEKIESMGYQVDFGSRPLPLQKNVKYTFCTIWTDDHKTKIAETCRLSKIDTVYEAVIEFICEIKN